MKTSKIQFNAKTFKSTRDVMSAYFGATHDLAVELDKSRTSARAYADVLKKDRSDLATLLLGGDNAKDIHRTREQIEESIKVNTEQYNVFMKPYKTLVEKTDKAIADGVALFNDKNSTLYKAYVAYVLTPTDENYDAYAKAMSDKFIALGLTDATVDNVAHYLVNADRFRKGSSAVRSGKIVDALTPKAFSEAILRKFYDNNTSAFANAKFAEYVRKCAEKSANK